jgi:hypothetical protein
MIGKIVSEKFLDFKDAKTTTEFFKDWGMWNENYANLMAKFRENNPWLCFRLIKEIKRLRSL